MYCPNESAECGQVDITLSDENEGQNITIKTEVFSPLCIYEVTTADKGVVDVNSESWITVIDPDALV